MIMKRLIAIPHSVIGSSVHALVSTVKPLLHHLPAVLLFSSVAVTQPVTAQAQTIEFRNTGKEALTVCVYRGEDEVLLIALRCWDLGPGESVKWNRGNDKSPFRMRFYKPFALEPCYSQKPVKVDDLLRVEVALSNCRTTLAGTTCTCRMNIVAKPRPSPKPKPPPAPAPKPPPAPAKKFTLRACNTTGAPVQFALAYSLTSTNFGPNFVAEGWWIVPTNDCMDVPLSELWKQQGYLGIGRQVTYIYAKSGRFFKQIWEGTEKATEKAGDMSFCINQKKAFALKHFDRDRARKTWVRVPCQGTDLELVTFIRLREAGPSGMYTFTF
jgi:uncharacterized membrane protein